MSTRLQLRRSDDDKVFLDRWGWECGSFGVFVHRMEAPDPGLDLHDHPWWFVSWVLKGEYIERRIPGRLACHDDKRIIPCTNRVCGNVRRRRWSLRAIRLDECHTITDLTDGDVWTLVLHGPKRRTWGFYTPNGWMPWKLYEQQVRAERRDVYVPISNVPEERLAK